MIKKKFDVPLTPEQFPQAATIIKQAAEFGVTRIMNVGTSVIESENCILLAREFAACFATVGVHPNDLTENWKNDIKKLTKLVRFKEENKIVGIGEIGFDKHYPDFNMQRQKDAFKAQVELALEFNVPLVVHTREAPEETLYALDEYQKEKNLRGVIHCFSENKSFADEVIKFGFVIGIGGTLTYPKNEPLREVFKTIPLEKIILETDAPFLPPQIIRGKENHPKYIFTIAEFLATIRAQKLETIAHQTSKNAMELFNF
jgi:TatD DNase family protein